MSSSEMVSWARYFTNSDFWYTVCLSWLSAERNTGLGIPVEERVRFYKDFISKALIDTVQVMLPVPLPGTELRYRLMKQNRIYPLEDIGWEYYDGNFPLFEPDEPMTSETDAYLLKKDYGQVIQVQIYVSYSGKYILISHHYFLSP